MTASVVVWKPLATGGGELCLPAQLEQLPNLMTQTQHIARIADLSDVQTSRLELAIEEAFVNVCHHTYGDQTESGLVICRFLVQTDRLTVEIIDQGAPFDPLTQPDPDTALDLADRHPGGLGIFFIKQLMDEVHYRREVGWNMLMFEIRRHPIPSSDE